MSAPCAICGTPQCLAWPPHEDDGGRPRPAPVPSPEEMADRSLSVCERAAYEGGTRGVFIAGIRAERARAGAREQALAAEVERLRRSHDQATERAIEAERRLAKRREDW